MKLFKIIRELKAFRTYMNNVDMFSKTDIFKQYRFNTGLFGQFGSIVRLEKMDVTDMENKVNDSMVKSQMVKYLSNFLEAAESYNLYSEIIAYKMENYVTEDTKKAKKYVFFKVEFQFLWNYLSFGYIFSRFLFLIILGMLIIKGIPFLNIF